jgi:Ca2+:H+ antiporter
LKKLFKFLCSEIGIAIPLAMFILLNFIARDAAPYSLSHLMVKFTTVSIFIVMLICAFNVVKHADWLAEKFGEPYGTLILTLAVITIEVALILTIMLAGKDDPTLARDTMFAVIMIALNGFAGLSLLTGGGKHRTQKYNIEGASAYIAVLIPLAVLCLILPNYTITSEVGTFSAAQAIIVVIVCVILYATFLIQQTITHRDYFKFSIDREEDNAKEYPIGSVFYHISMLIVGLLIMILLSKNLAIFLDYSIHEAGLPSKLGGFIIALLVLTPEGVSAIQSAYHNQLQRSINLCMGSAVATICLTVPSVLIVSILLGNKLVLGLDNTSVVLLVLTFLVSIITFTSRRTSVLNGMILLSLFLVYFALIFDAA